ncbi:unnamed protein product [Moneuplotes crassus]|uniref:Uncharacterized protein n=1 Tax=Euplotes crassus TaxID=5936 RepID=A0AAD2D9M1_EUPCR|nr:unnamed protein product [Moneuplotes crassus]
MEKALIPKVRSSIDFTKRNHKERLTLKERLEMPDQIRLATAQEPYLESPTGLDNLMGGLMRNSEKVNAKSVKNVSNNNSNKHLTHLGDDPSICSLLLDSNRDTDLDTNKLRSNLKKHLYERENKLVKSQNQNIQVLNDSNDQNGFQMSVAKEEQEFSLSKKHYKTRQQLQEFREKFIKDRYKDEESSCTDFSAEKPPERPHKETLDEEPTFGEIQGCNTLDLDQKENKLADTPCVPTQIDILRGPLAERYEDNILNIKHTPKNNKSIGHASQKSKNNEDFDNLQKSEEKRKEDRIQVKYLSEERNPSNTHNFRNTLTQFAQSNYEAQTIQVSNPFDKNCTSKLNKSLENLRKFNTNYSNAPNSIYSTIKRSVRKKEFSSDPIHKSIERPTLNEQTHLYQLKQSSNHEPRPGLGIRMASDYNFTDFQTKTGPQNNLPSRKASEYYKRQYTSLDKIAKNRNNDYKGTIDPYPRIKVQQTATQKPLYDTETSQELELDIGGAAQIWKDLKSSPNPLMTQKDTNQAQCQRCATLEDKVRALTLQLQDATIPPSKAHNGENSPKSPKLPKIHFEKQLEKLQEKYELELTKKTINFNTKMELKDQEWSQILLQTKQKCENKVKEILDYCSQQNKLVHTRMPRELLSPGTRENSERNARFREELLEEIADLKEAKKDLIGENHLLKSKISRLEQKVLSYKQQRISKNYDEEPTSMIFSNTLNFAVKKKPKSMEKHCKTVLEKYDMVRKEKQEKQLLHNKRRIKEIMLESDNSFSYCNPPQYTEESEEEDRPQENPGPDSQLYERIRKLEEIILKKKKQKY